MTIDLFWATPARKRVFEEYVAGRTTRDEAHMRLRQLGAPQEATEEALERADGMVGMVQAMRAAKHA